MTLFNVKSAKRIASGFHPDPTICEKPQGGYLMVNSSFEYFPGLPIFESADGENWCKIGNALSRPSQFLYESMDNNQGVYAPTLRWHEGLYYLIVTNVNFGNMILTSANPSRCWSDPVLVKGWPGIDPSLFFDEDGKVYICGNESCSEPAGIYLSRIDLKTGMIMGQRRRICVGITGSNPEGPHLYRRHDKFYLTWAEGGTESGHMENMARADRPFGPYALYPDNPLITNRSTHLTLQAIGHCDYARFDAERTLMVFHGTRNNDEYPAQGWIGRESYGVWFAWKDDWPDLCNQSYDCPVDGDGTSLEQDVEWITPSIDAGSRYKVDAKKGVTRIAIQASEQDFGLLNGPCLIGTRQSNMNFQFTAFVHDLSHLESMESGLVAYANASHYMTVSVSQCSGNNLVILASVHNAGLISTVGKVYLSSAQPLSLSICGDKHKYRFSVRPLNKEKAIMLGSAPCKVLSFSNSGGFTGTVLGVYAHGSGTATFEDVRYSTESLRDI